MAESMSASKYTPCSEHTAGACDTTHWPNSESAGCPDIVTGTAKLWAATHLTTLLRGAVAATSFATAPA